MCCREEKKRGREPTSHVALTAPKDSKSSEKIKKRCKFKTVGGRDLRQCDHHDTFRRALCALHCSLKPPVDKGTDRKHSLWTAARGYVRNSETSMAAWPLTPLSTHTHTLYGIDWLIVCCFNPEAFKHSSDGALQTTKHVKHVEGEGSEGQHSTAPPCVRRYSQHLDENEWRIVWASSAAWAHRVCQLLYQCVVLRWLSKRLTCTVCVPHLFCLRNTINKLSKFGIVNSQCCNSIYPWSMSQTTPCRALVFFDYGPRNEKSWKVPQFGVLR